MPAETSASMRRPPAALDPSLPSRRGTGLASLDPAIEASGSVKRPAPEVSSTRQRPADVGAEAEAKTGPRTKTPPLPLLAAGVVGVVVVAGLIFGGGGGGNAGSHAYSVADERRLTDLWLTHGALAWGGVRPTDGVTRAVEGVGATLLEPMAKPLRGRAPRFVVLNDDGSAQVLALTDGSVAITAAALRRLGSEAQLAALLAHTMAHTANGDVATMLDKRTDLGGAARAALDGPPPTPKPSPPSSNSSPPPPRAPPVWPPKPRPTRSPSTPCRPRAGRRRPSTTPSATSGFGAAPAGPPGSPNTRTTPVA